MTNNTELPLSSVNQVKDVDPLRISPEEPVSQLEKYLKNPDNQRFSPAWAAYAHALLNQPLSDQKSNSFSVATQAQLSRFDQNFSQAQKILYLKLRVVGSEVLRLTEVQNNEGANPRTLTDERLMIEICLHTNDSEMAEKLLRQYPSING